MQFAGKVREHIYLDNINLLLKVDAKWLCWANSTDGRGGEALRLADVADENMVILHVQWVPGNENPADHYTTAEGGKNWDENDLEALRPEDPWLELFSDAKASHNQFGITDRDGNPVWYGQFGDDDPIYNGEQSTGELSAAVKAVQFAGKVREHNSLYALNLLLKVDAEWLCWANSTDGRGGEALRLADVADENMVILHVQWVPGNENPADHYTTAEGGKNWDENDLETFFWWWW